MNRPPEARYGLPPGPPERGLRSVFVGNISYDVNEDQLKALFSQLQMLQQAFAARQEDSPYGPVPSEGKAPEAVARAVASLPPEKMFELMKQTKDLCRTNPQEARRMLVDNPQLAYAFLQAQVVMRIVDPQIAMAMLQRDQSTPQVPFHQAPQAAAPNPIHTNQPPAAHQRAPAFNNPPPPSFGRPPPNVPPPAAPKPPDNDGAQAQLLMQVLQLTPEEIAMLPSGDRERVIELRNQLQHI
ncbi:unnamed protein product, partial [Mesorhabditis spiculigera]